MDRRCIAYEIVEKSVYNNLMQIRLSTYLLAIIFIFSPYFESEF